MENEYPPSRTDLLHGLDVRFSAGKKQKIPEIPSRGNMWKLHGLDTFLTILCQILYEHFMFMQIYEDLHRFIICGYRLLVSLMFIVLL